MCCCCPSAISAIFCLWCQSGCRASTVAGALTFFPPEPPLYQFERHDKHGNFLGEREAGTNEDKDDDDNKRTDSDGDSSIGEIQGPPSSQPLEAETKGQTQKKIKSPIQELTDQAKLRKRRAVERKTRDSNDAKHGVTFKLLLDPRLQVPPHDEGAITAVKIASPRNVYIGALIYRVPVHRRTSSTRTMLFSHGNATDLGATFPMQVVLAHSLDINVVVYDYSGYGESGGVPTEASTYRDIDAVYDYVLDTLADGDSTKIILYGQSVGSGPCCYLASKKDVGVLGGLILHSPFTSGMRVLTPSRLLACLDIYPNIDRIPKVNCPVMVIHGKLDQEVDFSHGLQLYRAVAPDLRREPWWVPDRGHNDITDGTGKLGEYIRRIRTFLLSLDE
ncbi:hypothetical protein MPSEU_001050400 [Mayamaea pseudoterrestris]|nr:hypothetical protein MPSEU_001050400 [Mayamaea pseudoterrestris]